MNVYDTASEFYNEMLGMYLMNTIFRCSNKKDGPRNMILLIQCLVYMIWKDGLKKKN